MFIKAKSSQSQSRPQVQGVDTVFWNQSGILGPPETWLTSDKLCGAMLCPTPSHSMPQNNHKTERSTQLVQKMDKPEPMKRNGG